MPIAIAELSESLSTLVENTGKSVVRVDGGHRRAASGIVWSPKQIVTVARAVPNDEVTVAVDGKELKARVKGRDESTDSALLELDEALTPATFDEGASVKVGQLALRLGRPGETVRATSGILSAVGQKAWRTPRGAEVDFYLEADARSAARVLRWAAGRAAGPGAGPQHQRACCAAPASPFPRRPSAGWWRSSSSTAACAAATWA